MNKTVGNKLKSLRKQKGYSQEQVCEFLHISQSAYARIESGDSHSWAMHLVKLSVFYDIKPEEIIRKENVIIGNIGIDNDVDYADIVNQLSVKLILQYEERLKEKDEIIAELKNRLKTH
jgi:transcriptional regulator with XRE-family HTH domain